MQRCILLQRFATDKVEEAVVTGAASDTFPSGSKLTLSFCNVASDRKGTMVNDIPVDTVWMGKSFVQLRDGYAQYLRHIGLCELVWPNFGSTWRISPNNCPSRCSKRHRNFAHLEIEYDLSGW